MSDKTLQQRIADARVLLGAEGVEDGALIKFRGSELNDVAELLRELQQERNRLAIGTSRFSGDDIERNIAYYRKKDIDTADMLESLQAAIAERALTAGK